MYIFDLMQRRWTMKTNDMKRSSTADWRTRATLINVPARRTVEGSAGLEAIRDAPAAVSDSTAAPR